MQVTQSHDHIYSSQGEVADLLDIPLIYYYSCFFIRVNFLYIAFYLKWNNNFLGIKDSRREREKERERFFYTKIITIFSFVCQQQNTPSDPNTSLLSPQSNKSLVSNFSIKSPLSPTTPILSPTSKLILKTPSVLSPNTPSSISKSKRRRDRENRKNSQHYQESDILESYYRSSPADKISDYEDIWNTTDQSTQSTWNDRLKDDKIVCTPQDRLRSSNDRLLSLKESEKSLVGEQSAEKQIILKNDRFILRSDKLGYKEMTSPEFSSFKPVPEMKSPDQSSLEENGIGKRPDLLSRVCKYTY